MQSKKEEVTPIDLRRALLAEMVELFREEKDKLIHRAKKRLKQERERK